MMKKAAAVLAVLLLSACADSAPLGMPPDLTFNNIKPIALDVGKIEISNQYKPPMQAPNVDHTFRPTPADAAAQLLNKALTAAGGGTTLRVIIEDASVVDEALAGSNGFWDNMTQQPSDRYKAKISLRFQLVNAAAPDVIIGHAEVGASRNTVLLKGTSPAERDHAAQALTAELMSDVNDGLQSVVKDTFGKK